MPIHPNTLAIFKKLVTKTADLEKRRKKLDAEVAKRAAKLGEAISALDTTVLDIQLKALKGDIAELNGLLHDADVAVGDLNTLENDAAFMQERDDDADKVARVISETRDKVAQHFKALKQLENKGEEAWRKSLKSENFALRELARLHAGVTDLRTQLKARFEKLDKVAVKAFAAHEQRNAKALATTQAEAEALEPSMAKFEFDTHKKQVVELARSAESKDHDESTRATLKDGCQDLADELDAMSVWVEQTLKQAEAVKALKIEAIDVKKALKVLELDAKHEARLAKVLNGPPAGFEKGLQALATELKLGSTGKAMLQALRKAGVV